MKKLVIGNDHAAVALKQEIMEYLQGKGYEVINIGTDSTESCHYPEYGYKAARMVADGEVDGGIIICGTGVGISLAANKVNGIRCCVCSDPYTAKLSKQHNNTNMLAFGARVVGPVPGEDDRGFLAGSRVYGRPSSDQSRHDHEDPGYAEPVISMD